MEPNDYELRRVLREWQVPGAPAELEQRVNAVRRPALWWPTFAMAVTSAALLAIGALLIRAPQPVAKPPAPAPPLLTVDREGDAPFVPIPYVAPLDSYETGMVMRVSVPVAQLIGAGFEVPLADPTAIVVADVLVGDDGRAHAVRLVSGGGD
jgi:hypothetical protein